MSRTMMEVVSLAEKLENLCEQLLQLSIVTLQCHRFVGNVSFIWMLLQVLQVLFLPLFSCLSANGCRSVGIFDGLHHSCWRTSSTHCENCCVCWRQTCLGVLHRQHKGLTQVGTGVFFGLGGIRGTHQTRTAYAELQQQRINRCVIG